MRKRKQTKNFCSSFVKRKANRVMAVILTAFMAVSVVGYGGITANAVTQSGNTYDISTAALTINSSNVSAYNNAVITGTSNSNMITIDGVTANLTLSDMNLNIESSTSTTEGWYSAIKLTNGAALNLTITGNNTVTGGTEHAAINVPTGCSLVITQDSTGTLTATAGNDAAGIGADSGGNTEDNIKTIGSITINGGTVKAYGSASGAGIGGTMASNTGNIKINGGTVYAKGGGGVTKVSCYFAAICGAGIGGGSQGYVENISITGGRVTAVGGHHHEYLSGYVDAPSAGIGCGSSTGITSDGKFTCGTISITGGVVSATGGNNNAVNAIGYGLSPDFDISGDNYVGSVTISDNASVNTNGGAIHPLTNTVNPNMYKFAMTIYDGRLTNSIEEASIKVNGKTYLDEIMVSENRVGTISCSLVYNGVLTGEQTVEISAGGYSWSTTVNFTENNFDYTPVIGSKLYPAYLWFYDTAITSDISGVSLSVKQNGNVLNSNAEDGMVQLVCDGTITKYKDGVGKMTAYLSAGSSELTATVPGLNGENAITVSGKTINASSDGTIIILLDKYSTPQLSTALDLSYGNITFADNGGKLDITYTPENGQSPATATGQYYQNEYEIVQSDSTVTTNQILFQNTTDVVNVKLNGINMKSAGKAIDLQNAKAKLNLSGTNTIDCGGESSATEDAGFYIGIHAASGSELTIDGSGSLEIKNPSELGVGIGGYLSRYVSGTQQIIEGAGTIRIQGGTLTVSGKNGAAIGSCANYEGNDFGSIYITGGVVNASSEDGAAIGGSYMATPANVYITGGRVKAKVEHGCGGAAIGSGYSGINGGKIVISGGYVEAAATANDITAIGGGFKGVCPDITISGGTVKATGAVASIGRASNGSGGSLKITGGSISTINNGKPTINLTPTNDGTTPVYYTGAYVREIYGKDASVNNASITGCDYGFKDVKTDANGVLHLYLPASAAGTETKASFNDVNYSGIITLGDNNGLQKPFSPSGTGTQADPYILETADDLEELSICVRTGQNYSGKYFKLKNDITYSSMPIGCFSENGSVNSPFCGNFDGAGHTVTLDMINENSGIDQAVALFGCLGSGSSVENIVTTGNIISSGKYSGGIAGAARDGAVNISNCWSSVNMDFSTGGDCTYGGIVGLINNSGNVTMTNCCFTGNITTSKTDAGTTLTGVGGLCGWQGATLNAANCYVDASFGSDSIIASGKYMARNGGNFTNCYYNKDKKLTNENTTVFNGTEAVTSDFTSGKIAWLLQNGQLDPAAQVWGQTLSYVAADGNTPASGDAYPVFLKMDGSNKVHKVTFEAGTGLESGLPEGANQYYYVNSSMTLPTLTLTDEEKNEGYGYNFQITSGTATLDTANNQLKDISGDVTVTVKKELKYTIYASSKDTTGANISAEFKGLGSYVSGVLATVEAPIKDGYNFVGWYQASAEAPGYTGDILCKNRVYTFNVNENKNLTAVYKSLGTVDVTIDGGSSYTINGSEYTAKDTSSYAIGTTVTVAVDNTAADFAYWADKYNMIISPEKSYTFNVTGPMTVTAVYNTKAENKSIVIFKSYYGQVMSRMQISSSDTITMPAGPTRYGYNFTKWSMTADQIKNQIASGTDVITVIPVYALIDQSYTITVTGGTGSGDYKQNAVVTATADAPIGGEKFSNWTDEAGKILSYNTTYQFYADKDAAITANYVQEDALVETKGTAEIINVDEDTENSKIIFVSMVTVPEECEIQKAGIIATSDEAIGNSGDGFNKDTAAYVRGNAWSGNAYRYTWTKNNVTAGQTWYVRAYLLYKDTNGNLITVYGDMVTGVLNN